MEWGFYGRRAELEQLRAILSRNQDYAIEKVAIAAQVPARLSVQIRKRGWLTEDLPTLLDGL